MKYKVFFHFGDDLTIKTRASRGYVSLDDSGLRVDGPSGRTIPACDIQHAELFRLHGLGRVVQVEFRGGRLFVSVIRFMIGQFASINFLKTGSLYKQIAAIAESNRNVGGG